MDEAGVLDALFRQALAAMDAGDVAALGRLLHEHPRLAAERLRFPGAWLREQVGTALDGFFREPYLLWFVAEDPPRAHRLPPNIAEVARTVIAAARREPGAEVQAQLDYALLLVAWSAVARQAGVQIALLDVLVDAGACPDAGPNNALVNRHTDAAAHLVGRGAPLTLASALCLGRWTEADRLAGAASAGQRQFALVLAALNGQAQAITRLIDLGVDVSAPCPELYAHATPLHHAVSSGSLEAVRVLVEAGAPLHARDTAFQGTPLGWALHYQSQHAHDGGESVYGAIAHHLRERGST